MPIYDYKCSRCGGEMKDVFSRTYDRIQHCVSCGEVMEKQPVRVSPLTFPKDGVFLENVSSEGKRFFSKGEMRKYERENDAYIDCAHC